VPLAQRLALPAVWLFVIALFGVLEPDTFLTSANFQTIFGSQAVLAVLTLGLLLPLTAGDYDLSVASVLSLSAMVTALLNVNEGWPVGLAVLAAVGAAVIVGVVNGALVALLELDSFITTLGTAAVVSGVVLGISSSQTVGGVSDSLVNPVIRWDLLGIPLAFWYALILCVALWYVLDFTPAGRRLLFTGRGRSVARLSGVRVARARFSALVGAAAVAGLAGVLYAGTNGGADPTSGGDLLLPAFAAAFLGATGIAPGRFNAWGSLVAVYFLVTGVTGLQLLGVESFVQQLFYGGALVAAVAVSRLARGLPRITRGEMSGG
jgi:ribose transport system permease protein